MTRFGYSSGDLVRIADALNRSLTVGTDAVGRTITVTDALNQTSTIAWDALEPVYESNLMRLIESVVKSAHTLENKTLVLSFTNGHTLAFHDDTPMYEAYRMKFGKEEEIIV